MLKKMKLTIETKLFTSLAMEEQQIVTQHIVTSHMSARVFTRTQNGNINKLNPAKKVGSKSI